MDINIANQNVKSLASALCSVGAISATVEYSGYGDSGGVDEISIGWPDTVVHRENPGKMQGKMLRERSRGIQFVNAKISSCVSRNNRLFHHNVHLEN